MQCTDAIRLLRATQKCSISFVYLQWGRSSGVLSQSPVFFGKEQGRRVRGGMCVRETERKSVLCWGFPAPASPALPAFISLMGLKKPGSWSRMTLFGLSQRSVSSPFPSPKLSSSTVWGETGQCGKAFTAAFIPNTSNAPQSFPKSLCPSEFVCVCRENLFI